MTNTRYLNSAAEFDVPSPPVGDRYADEVPATFDIAERAKLTMNALAGVTDPAPDHEMYFGVAQCHNPPTYVRLPENPTGVQCVVNDEQRPVAIEGSYLDVGEVSPGDRFEVLYDLDDQTRPLRAGAKEYTTRFKGSSVVSIDPPGSHGPLYDRTYFLNPTVPTISVERFVPDAAPSR